MKIDFLYFGFLGFLLFAACDAEDPDLIPDPFAFDSITNAELNTIYYSDTIVLSGIDAPIEAWFNDVSDSKIFVNREAVQNPLMLNPGDEIFFEVLSSEEYGDPRQVNLLIGEFEARFKVITRPFPLEGIGYPGTAFRNLNLFRLGESIYLGIGSTYEQFKPEFFAYNLLSQTWNEKIDYPGSPDIMYSFSANNLAYIGTSGGLQRYQPNQDLWTELTGDNFGESVIKVMIIPTVSDVLAMVWFTDEEPKMYTFNSVEENWDLIRTLETQSINWQYLFVFENNIYFKEIDSNTFFHTDLDLQNPVILAELPLTKVKSAMVLHDAAFIFGGDDGKSIYRFQPENDIFKPVELNSSFPNEIRSAISDGDKAFVVGISYSGVLAAGQFFQFIYD
jgi:hypothetical protein